MSELLMKRLDALYSEMKNALQCKQAEVDRLTHELSMEKSRHRVTQMQLSDLQKRVVVVSDVHQTEVPNYNLSNNM